MKIQMSIKSVWGEEKKVLAELDKMLSRYHFAPRDCLELKTALAEACLNAIEHGNKLNPTMLVEVVITVTAGVVTADILDEGRGLTTVPNTGAKASTSGRGWGLLLMKTLVNEWYPYCEVHSRRFGVRLKKIMKSGGSRVEKELKITEEQKSEIYMLHLEGDITKTSGDELLTWKKWEDGLPAGARFLLLNFSKVGYINSAGIAALIRLIRIVKELAPVGCFGLTYHYEKLFQMVGLTRYLKIYPSLWGAEEGIKGDGGKIF